MINFYKKLQRPMDARSKRGIYSRGKPIYGIGGIAPNPKGNKLKPRFDLNTAAIERYLNGTRRK